DWKQYITAFSVSHDQLFQPYEAAIHLNQAVNTYMRDHLQKLQDHASQTQREVRSVLNQIDNRQFSGIVQSWYTLIQAKEQTLLPQDISWLNQFRQTMQPLLPALDELPLAVACDFASSFLPS